jgi:hypothetical protein
MMDEICFVSDTTYIDITQGSGIIVENVNIARIIQLENNLDEILWVQIHAKGQSFRLCNTYCPQWTDNEYWSRVTHAIGLTHQINENIVISNVTSFLDIREKKLLHRDH